MDSEAGLEKENSGLLERIASLEAEKNGLVDGRIASLEADKSGLQDAKAGLEKEKTDLQQRFAIVEADKHAPCEPFAFFTMSPAALQLGARLSLETPSLCLTAEPGRPASRCNC